MANYEMIIGIETHVELLTASKIFCNCTTMFGGKPNTHCCPICIGMPGTLPVLNKEVVNHAIKLASSLNCRITNRIRFDRKNYFYPDLPKAYQVSQLYLPIGKSGYLDIEVNNDINDGVMGIETKRIRIHEMHMEEDAGKLVHDSEYNETLIDYNRAGVPLIEIVSAPDIKSADEAIQYLEKLRDILLYLGISDCKMQEGSFRADINLSVRKIGEHKLGVRTEMKNLNSFRNIMSAIEYERERQIQVLESGGAVEQETRRWDDQLKQSIAMRTKSKSRDYRYFPDPDIPEIIIDKNWIDEIQSNLPELREDKISRYYNTFGITMNEAKILTEHIPIAYLFEETIKVCNHPREVANWIIMDCMRMIREQQILPEDMKLSAKNLASLILLIEEGKINKTIAKEVFNEIFINDRDPFDYIKEKGLVIVADESLLRKTVEKVVSDHPQSVIDYKSGKTKVVTYLMGQTMKAMGGKAEPQTTMNIIKEILEKM